MKSIVKQAWSCLPLVFLLCSLPICANQSLVINSITWSNPYTPFDVAQPSQEVQGEIDSTKNENTTTFFIGADSTPITPYRTLSFGANTLNYQLYTDLNQTNPLLSAATAASSSDLITLSYKPKKSKTESFSFYIAIPEGQSVAPGTYTGTVNFNLYKGSFASMTLLDIASVSITATVASQIQSVIVSTGSPFDENQPATYSMDFGVVSDTQSLSADLSIRSNDGYDVQARSLNQNKLVHTSESNATMNYKFYVNSQLMDLTNGSNVQVATGTGITALTGTNIPLQVTLDDTFNKLSGTYQDTIIFTVAPSP